MGQLILCKSPRAKSPFYIESGKVNIYSLEELMYFVQTARFVARDDFAKPEFVDWVERELGMKELAVMLREKNALIAFCQGIQQGAPIDAFVVPEPWDMPGYDCPVIMAAGAFIQGASIELSADAPMRPPATVYMQGGLTYESGKAGISLAVEELLGEN